MTKVKFQLWDESVLAMRPELRCDERTREVLSLLLHAPAPSWQARPAMKSMMMAGIELS